MKWTNVILVPALVISTAACGSEHDDQSDDREAVDVAVSTSVASHGVITAPATVLASERAVLATRMSGTIRQIEVDIGARVSAGAALVTLDTKEIDARIESAEAAAQLARQWHDRIASLAADGAATAQELDDAVARLDVAEAGLRDARAQRDYIVLRAPFSGVITARRADPGDLAVPGVPILEMIGEGSLKIEADLPAELSGRLSVGDVIAVHRSETGERHAAQVTRVVPAVERTSRRFRIEAHFEAGPSGLPNIAPGTFVRIELDEPTSTTRWIPADAIISRGQLNGVYVVDGEQLRLRWVRLGQRIDDTVELLAGPPPSALLVRHPAASIADGQPVAEVQRDDWVPPFINALAVGEEDLK